ncbi:MAG: YqcI/YcgG family protein [Bacillota bacterium]
MKLLLKNSQTKESGLLKWQLEVVEHFKNMMTNRVSPFPCIPAIQAYSFGHLRYGFVGDPRQYKTSIELASLLKEFSKSSREYGFYTSLIIFFYTSEDLMKNDHVGEYEKLFWKQLSNLHDLDDKDWPQDIPEDPEDNKWEFSFHGEKYFMFCATPSHSQRRSRYFPCMMMAITPRWVLQRFNTNEKVSGKIKQRIRNRLENYDTTEIHHSLKSYGHNDNYEWKQYFLHDDEYELPKCPFLRMMK